MSRPNIDQRVVLIDDVPEYGLVRGETGTVCSTWHVPLEVYEVEFHCMVTGDVRRALLRADQLEDSDSVAPELV